MPEPSKRKKYIPAHKRFPKEQQPLRLKKEHIIRNVHFRSFPDISLRKCSKLVNGVFETLGMLLSKGMTVTITNFGTFKIQDMAESKNRGSHQIRSGEACDVHSLAGNY